MPAYVVFMRDEMLDRVEFEEYAAKVDASFEGHDVKFLADYGTIETLEGAGIEGAVILEFPDMDAARTWYRSPEYQATAQHRFRGARYRGFIVEGP
ncbi:uncharacterized protein (DUF1330 family) [Novosphingobium chloroacetimidivorans]|uniref:Uncharacterized protein (DUF1330 family) n=1 Tax=Novosphingobium chloroacetimidivorans TaxID=1428314 RepID=A0A7W7K9Q6_9SPHN|nr:DUF1330 domain-containing protein [Novosphingobium chloroacetimidivorans]MBB4858806.1 uncharacterized protein (DUF1330 family) [Novosphingobium chloroacetimidivorans]